MRLVPWAGTTAADCTVVLRRAASIGALASAELLRIQLDDLLQGTGDLHAVSSHNFILQASFTPEAAATSCPGACAHWRAACRPCSAIPLQELQALM